MYLFIETNDNVFELSDDRINTVDSFDLYFLYSIIELISGRYTTSIGLSFSNNLYFFVRLTDDNYLIDLGFNIIGRCIYRLELNYESTYEDPSVILDIPSPEDPDPNHVDFGCLYISLYPENFRYVLNGERVDLTLEDSYFQIVQQIPIGSKVGIDDFTEFINNLLKGHYTDRRKLVSNRMVSINGQLKALSTFTDGYKEAVYYLFWCFTLIINNPAKENVLIIDLSPYKVSDFIDEKLRTILIDITRELGIRLVTNNTTNTDDQINRNK